MATCVIEHPSPKMSMKEYPRKLLRAATYDSLIPILKCRKRLLSEHNEYDDLTTKFDNDETSPNKRKKTGNFNTWSHMSEMNDYVDSIYSSLHHLVFFHCV